MGKQIDPSQRFENRIQRLKKMMLMHAPVELIASECLLIAHAACEMGYAPIYERVAEEVAKAVRKQRAKAPPPTAEDDKEIERMGQEVHLPVCPAYGEWIRTCQPAKPDQCRCGGLPH